MGLETKTNAASLRMSYRSEAWYETYVTALFESDRAQIAQRIRRAEHLIVSREHELFAPFSDTPERRALNNALQSLRALGGCLNL